MGLFDTVDSLFSTAVSDVTSLFGGSPSTSGSYLGGPSYGSGTLPVIYNQPQPMNVGLGTSLETMGQTGSQIVGALYRVPKIAFNFPLLLDYLQSKNIPWSKGVQWLWSLVRKFGPAALAGIVGQAVVSELIEWSATKAHKKRRMNVSNVKALRRGLRRLKGFERLSHRVSAQLGRAARSGRSYRRSAGRCVTCRKSPCMC